MKSIFASAVAAALLGVVAFAPAFVPEAAAEPRQADLIPHAPIHPHRNADGSLKRGINNQIYTNNWSGFAVANFLTSQTYAAATATWQVPSVSYVPFNGTSTWEYSANWIGIGGYCQNAGCSSVDNSLIQLGTGQSASDSGGAYYYAWYELLPAGLTVIPNPVRPNDIMTAALECAANCFPGVTQTWVLTMSDETAGWTWNERFQYLSSMGSAEWIVEAPSSGGTLPLDNFSQATFQELTANGVAPNLSLSANGIAMYDPWGQTSNPSAPSGAWFTACWGNGTTLTPCNTGSFNNPTASSAPAPTDTLSASPTTITAGQASTLSWSSVNATSCTGGNFNASDTSGSAVVYPTATTTYSVSCSGAGGSVTAQVTVHVGSSTTTKTHGNSKRNT